MAKAGAKGILLFDYIKDYEQPEMLVRKQLDRGELRYTWKDNNGNECASDVDRLPPKGWWLWNTLIIDYEQHSVRGNAMFGPVFPMFFIRVFPKITPKAEDKGHHGINKFDLTLKILANIKPAVDLKPAEIEKMVLAKVPPEYRRRWEKPGPDGRLKRPISRTVINRAYQEFLKARSSK